MIIILGIIIYCSGVYIFELRYYFFNKYNVHAKRKMLDRLDTRYNQEFEMLSTEFETKEVEIDGSTRAVHIWTYKLKDNQGKQFYAYVYRYGSVGIPFDGNSCATDYYNYIDTNYGQLCIEERLGNQFDLSQYRQEKGVRYDDLYWVDYIFICTENNTAEIAELLTDMYFKEPEFSDGGYLNCLVNNEEGETLFSYYWWEITRELQKQNKEITEETVYTYILQKLENQAKADEHL